MITDIEKLLEARPFTVFVVHLADGDKLTVPSVEHVHIFPNRERLLIHRDDGGYAIIAPDLITRVSSSTRHQHP